LGGRVTSKRKKKEERRHKKKREKAVRPSGTQPAGEKEDVSKEKNRVGIRHMGDSKGNGCGVHQRNIPWPVPGSKVMGKRASGEGRNSKKKGGSDGPKKTFVTSFEGKSPQVRNESPAAEAPPGKIKRWLKGKGVHCARKEERKASLVTKVADGSAPGNEGRNLSVRKRTQDKRVCTEQNVKNRERSRRSNEGVVTSGKNPQRWRSDETRRKRQTTSL